MGGGPGGAKPAPEVASRAGRSRADQPQPVALVGFREWIFSENSGQNAVSFRWIASICPQGDHPKPYNLDPRTVVEH